MAEMNVSVWVGDDKVTVGNASITLQSGGSIEASIAYLLGRLRPDGSVNVLVGGNHGRIDFGTLRRSVPQERFEFWIRPPEGEPTPA